MNLFQRKHNKAPAKKDEPQRKTGSWCHEDIEALCNQVAEIPGEFAEIGVFRGKAFVKVVTMAASQNRMAHAFDSFQGMDEPSYLDGKGYPKGKFDVGGPDAFRAIMDENGVSREAYRLWAGYVPDCFRDVDEHLRFSFVILDLDHYEPTVEALQWVWPRLAHGAILALDDFNPRMKGLAARAIKEFLRQANDFDIVDFFNNQLVLKKL